MKKSKFEELLENQDMARMMTKRELEIALTDTIETGFFGFHYSPYQIWPGLDLDINNKKFLDIGCGGLGLDNFYMWLYGARLSVGIDINPWSIFYCKDQLYHLEDLFGYILKDRETFSRAWFKVIEQKRRPNNIDNIKFSEIEVENIPDNYFDVVNCSLAGPSGQTDPRLIEEAKRVCKPEGLVRICSRSGEKIIYKGDIIGRRDLQ